MSDTPKTEPKAPAKKPVLLQAVHGDLVHPLTALRFEMGRPTKCEVDAWIQSQIDAGKLTDDI
jgi:hypothetical protein